MFRLRKMKTKKIPMRRCVGCMESKPKQKLLRIACIDGEVRPDPTGKANGRGVYLCRDMACFEKARKKKAISRGLMTNGLPPEVYDVLKADLEQYIAEAEDK
jgi:predicted RNA-binding protein YlxR (DUF448 family)